MRDGLLGQVIREPPFESSRQSSLAEALEDAVEVVPGEAVQEAVPDPVCLCDFAIEGTEVALLRDRAQVRFERLELQEGFARRLEVVAIHDRTEEEGLGLLGAAEPQAIRREAEAGPRPGPAPAPPR